MRLYYFMEEEHLDEYDKIVETEDNPLGLEPNAKATPIAIRDYYQFLISITNHNKENLDEKVEGLMYDKELLSKAMIEAFKKSKCYKLKSEEERNIIINFIKEDPLVEDPFIWV